MPELTPQRQTVTFNPQWYPLITTRTYEEINIHLAKDHVVGFTTPTFTHITSFKRVNGRLRRGDYVAASQADDAISYYMEPSVCSSADNEVILRNLIVDQNSIVYYVG